MTRDERIYKLKNGSDTAIWASNEIEKMEAAMALAYGYLLLVNNEPGTPMQFSPQSAAYKVRKELGDLLTQEQRERAINNVMSIIHKTARNEELLPNADLTGRALRRLKYE